MSFQHLNALYVDLRDALRAQVEPASMGDVNVRPPAGESDEASFLRMTAWCYALFFEAGRTTIPFLLGLSVPASGVATRDISAILQSVQSLRTSLSHNLGFDDGHDLQIRRTTSDWFVRACGAVIPADNAQWRACCLRLCEEAGSVLDQCSAALSAVALAGERDVIFERLRHRTKRDLPAHMYDRFVTDAAARIGEKINARQLRERRLNRWRAFVEALPDDADLESEIERLIESDVIEHFRARLPISGRDLITEFGLEPGPIVRTALEFARHRFEGGVRDRRSLLDAVREDLSTLSDTETAGPEVKPLNAE